MTAPRNEMIPIYPGLLDRFRAKFTPEAEPGGCWIWTGAKIKGYGVMWAGARFRAVRAVRLAFEVYRGPIPRGLTLDHVKCDRPDCVNPWHVEPATFADNAMRSPRAIYKVKAAWTHCAKGHEFTPENTKRHHGRRRCARCQREYARQWRAA